MVCVSRLCNDLCSLVVYWFVLGCVMVCVSQWCNVLSSSVVCNGLFSSVV